LQYTGIFPACMFAALSCAVDLHAHRGALSRAVPAGGLGGKLHVKTLIATEDAASMGHISEPWLECGAFVTVTEPVMKKITGLEAVPAGGYWVAGDDAVTDAMLTDSNGSEALPDA
jgi:hypothetical protein